MTFYGILTLTIIILGITTILYIAFSWFLARLWCKPRRLPISKSPADFDMAFEAIQFFSHGVSIQGWFIPSRSDSPQPPVIVLAHGWCKNSVEMLPLAQHLHQADFALLLFDARGHGASGEDGPITILKLAEDIIAAMGYLETRSDIDKNRIGLLGRSIGGSAAILAASLEPRFQAIISCSAFANPKALTRDFLTMKHIPAGLFAWPVFRFIESWLGTTLDKVAPQNRVDKINAPLLLVHGEKDQYIKPSNLEILYAHASQELTERLLIPERGHSNVMRDPKCTQEILAFLIKNLYIEAYQIGSLAGEVAEAKEIGDLTDMKSISQDDLYKTVYSTRITARKLK